MIRTAFSLLLLATAAAPATAQVSVQASTQVTASLEATPQLRRDVTVSSDLVRIGDLIANAGPAAATAIFRAPDLGQTGSLPAKRVLDAVLPYGLVVVDTNGVTDVTITRASRVIGADDIEARIMRALSSRYPLGDAKNVKVMFDREARPIELEQTITGDLLVARMSYDTNTRRFDLTFELPDATSQRRAFRYTGVAVETVEVATITRALARGDVVKASDVTVERRPKTEVAGEPPAPANDVTGLAARRAVRAGAALRVADLMKPELVTRNDTVTLQYQVPGILVSLRGKALDSGAEGDTVSVLNVESKRTVVGIVTGPGRVTVSGPPARFAKADETKR